MADHRLRQIRAMRDAALRELSAEFEARYAAGGRASIAPERLLGARLLQILYSRRSERRLMEEMNYNLLFRWFVGLEMDDAVWDVTVYTKNRERLMAGEVAQKFFAAVLKPARGAALLSDEHFRVDGTLIEGWASRRSFAKKPEPPPRGTGARGRKMLRDPHESKTDPEARRFRRSQAAESRPSYLGHVSRAGRGVGDAGASQRRHPEDHAGSGPGISGRTFHRRVGSAAGRATCGRVRGDQQTLAELAACRGAGRSGISAKSEETKKSGTSIWLDQTRGRNAADEVSRTTPSGVDVPVGRGGIEPARYAASAVATGVVRRHGCVHRSTKRPENTKSGRKSAWKSNSQENRA